MSERKRSTEEQTGKLMIALQLVPGQIPSAPFLLLRLQKLGKSRIPSLGPFDNLRKRHMLHALGRLRITRDDAFFASKPRQKLPSITHVPWRLFRGIHSAQ
mmetsp:Transcript_45319/g.67320  ORF Transcript_45319/g.67320 Transcript_45319/m.67320 type:complete len:101 (-) Transcript_45319:1373-1675(-)